MMRQVEGIDVTKRELEVVMYSFAVHFTGQVELASAEIYSATSDPAIRRAAIEWNMNASSEAMRACFFHDPLVALVSAWALTIQMREFFESGSGKDVFGPYQDIAVATSQKLERGMIELVRAVWKEGDLRKYEEEVASFAMAHPLKNLRFVREGYDKATLKAMGAQTAGGLGAVGSMNEQVVAMADRMNIMIPYMQRQIHWQSALLMEDSKDLAGELTDSALVAVREEMSGHLDPLFEFVDGQRVLIAGDLARERAATLDEVARILATERSEVFKAMASEREALMRDINALTVAVLERVTRESQPAVTAGIDRFYTRTLQLFVIPFFFVVVAFIVVLLWVRSKVNQMLDRSYEDRRPS